MIPKTAIAKTSCSVAVCAVLLAWTGMSVAAEPRPDQYRPNQFLGLDLSAAVLSPKPLGPPAQFEHVRIEDASGDAPEQARAEPAPAPDKVAADKSDTSTLEPEAYARGARAMAKLDTRKPRGAPRVRLARHHGNPLDAQAFDTRIQVWPCRTGGICNWQRQ